MPLIEEDWTTVHAANRAALDACLLVVTGWPVRYGSAEYHQLPADHLHRTAAMRQSAQAWWRYWQPDAVATRRAAQADLVDRLVAERVREISLDVSDPLVWHRIGAGPSWRALQRLRYPWLFDNNPSVGEESA